MKRILAVTFFTVIMLGEVRAAERLKLVVAIAVDQFRYDYLLRFRAEYKQGLDRMLTRGAVFTNAYYQHFPTVTAIGHSTFLSGATPSISGIVANDWYDRESGKSVTSVSDDAVKILGGPGEGGASPHRLLGQHGGRRTEDGRWWPLTGDRDLDEGPQRHPAVGPHGRRGVLV